MKYAGFFLSFHSAFDTELVEPKAGGQSSHPDVATASLHAANNRRGNHGLHIKHDVFTGNFMKRLPRRFSTGYGQSPVFGHEKRPGIQ